jgi:hypothetical protein
MSQDPRTPTVVTGLRLDAVIWARFRAYARFMNADLSRMASAAVAEYLDRRSFPDGKPRDGASPVPLISETGYLTRRRPTRQELIARAQWEQRLRRTLGPAAFTRSRAPLRADRGGSRGENRFDRMRSGLKLSRAVKKRA